MWFLTIDTFVGIPVFIAKLSEETILLACFRGLCEGEGEEGEKEKDGDVQVEVEEEVEENQGETLIMDGMEMTVKDSRTT